MKRYAFLFTFFVTGCGSPTYYAPLGDPPLPPLTLCRFQEKGIDAGEDAAFCDDTFAAYFDAGIDVGTYAWGSLERDQ